MDTTDSSTLYKLMILFMLDHLEFPLTNSQLSKFFVTKGYSTYFQLQEAISYLEYSDFIQSAVVRNTSTYALTSAGHSAIVMFENKIPQAIKDDILTYFEEQEYVLRKETNVMADYYPLKTGDYMVRASILERGHVLMELGLNVVNKEQAIYVCDRWNAKSEQLYQAVIESLLMEE